MTYFCSSTKLGVTFTATLALSQMILESNFMPAIYIREDVSSHPESWL